MAPIPPGPAPRLKRHPIRTGIGGLLGGIGVALMLVLYGKLTLGTAGPIIIIAVVTVAGVAWAFVAPPRQRRRPAPPPPPGSPPPQAY